MPHFDVRPRRRDFSYRGDQMNLNHPYSLLGPLDMTDEDMCGCGSRNALILRDAMSPNPIFCATCFGWVIPDDIRLPHELVYPIAQWREVSASLYRLWLDSGSYETWAATQLLDPQGEVNVRGRDLAARLSQSVMLCYYWWFSSDGLIPAAVCPVCAGILRPWPKRNVQFCEACRVVV